LEVFAMEFGIVSDSRERTAIAFEADHNVWKRLAFDAVYKKSDEIWDQILLSPTLNDGTDYPASGFATREAQRTDAVATTIDETTEKTTGDAPVR